LSMGYVLTRRQLAEIACHSDNHGSIYTYESSIKDLILLGLPKSLRMGTLFLALATIAAMQTDYLWLFVGFSVMASSLFIFNELSSFVSSYLAPLISVTKWIVFLPYTLIAYAPTVIMALYFELTKFDPPIVLTCFDRSKCNTVSYPCNGQAAPNRDCNPDEEENDFFLYYYMPVLTLANVVAIIGEDLILICHFGYQSDGRRLIGSCISFVTRMFNACQRFFKHDLARKLRQNASF